MNSRKSWVNIPLLKNIIKSNLFPAKVSLIIFAGIFILSVFSGNGSGMISQVAIMVYGISAVVLTTIYPCFLQSYQVNKTKSSMMCSLPLSTRCVWFTNYLAGYLIAVVTLLIEGLGIMSFLGFNNYESGGNIYIRFIIAIFLLLFVYYTLAYLVCSLSGNRLGQVVFSLAAYALPVILLLGFVYICPRLVPAYLNNGIDNLYFSFSFPLLAGMMFIFNAEPYLFFHVFFGIITLVCSYYIYRNRENEYIGEPFVFHKIIIVLKAVLIVTITICGFGIILLAAQIDITFGFKGLSLLLLIYILIGMIVSIIVEIIFKGKYIYRNLLIYIPILIVVFASNYFVANKQYLSVVNDFHYEIKAELSNSSGDRDYYLNLQLNDQVTSELLDYVNGHRDYLHFENYNDNHNSEFVSLYVSQYKNKSDDIIYNSIIYNIDKEAIIEFFNKSGSAYFDKLFNNTEELSKENALICYVDEYAVYLNKEEIQQLIKLVSNQKIAPNNMFNVKTYSFSTFDNNIYQITINEEITNFITNDELIARAKLIENCRQVISDINNSDSTKYEEQIRQAVATQFKHETVDIAYSTGDYTVIGFSDDEVVYQQTYEVITKEGNSYTYPLEFTLKESAGSVIVSDIRVGG